MVVCGGTETTGGEKRAEIERFRSEGGERNRQYQKSKAIGRDPGRRQHLHRLLRYVCAREAGRQGGREVVLERVCES